MMSMFVFLFLFVVEVETFNVPFEVTTVDAGELYPITAIQPEGSEDKNGALKRLGSTANSGVSQAELPVAVTGAGGENYRGVLTQLDGSTVTLKSSGISRAELPVKNAAVVRSLQRSPYRIQPATAKSIAAAPKRYQPKQGSEEKQFADSLARRRTDSVSAPARIEFPKNAAVIELNDGSIIVDNGGGIMEDGKWMAPPLDAHEVSRPVSEAVYETFPPQVDQPFLVVEPPNPPTEGERRSHTLPISHIASFRFNVSNINNVTADNRWRSLSNNRGDQLVVGKPGAFDIYTGVLKSVSSDTVFFTTDGETLPIPKKKVYGVILSRDLPQKNSQPSAVNSQLSLWNGTKLALAKLEFKDGFLSWTAHCGLAGISALEMVKQIDFTPNFRYLLEHNRPCVIDGKVYLCSVELRAEQQPLNLRLPNAGGQLSMVAGIEDQYRPFAAGELELVADRQTLGVWTLRGDQRAISITVALPKDIKTLEWTVRPLKNWDIPTIITLADMRVSP